MATDIGYYTLPVILSFKGIDEQVNSELGDKLKPAAKKAGEDYAKGMAEGVKSGKSDIGRAAEDIAKPIGDAVSKAGAEAGKKISDGLGKAARRAARRGFSVISP